MHKSFSLLRATNEVSVCTLDASDARPAPAWGAKKSLKTILL